MPSFNVTISNSSPLVQYAGSWSDTPKTDNDWQQYLNDTYHLTNENGATATLQFNGSAIYIFGARKPGYGAFSVTLDGGAPFQTDPPATSTKEFNVLLYNATSLDATKEHQIALSNVAGSSQGSLDLDYMIITAGDGYAQTTADNVVWNENNTNIAYSTGWETLTGVNYTDGTTQLTYTQGALATVNFNGNAIALYGTLNADHGTFSVSIDDGPQSNFDGSAPEPRFGSLLYYANGLPGGGHVLKLTDVSPGGQNTNGLELDTVVVSSWPDPPSSGNTPTHTSGGTSSSTTGGTVAPAQGTNTSTPDVRHVATGAIAGAVVAAVVILVLLALGAFFFLRHRRHRRQDFDERHNVLLEEESRPDPFILPSGSGVGMSQLNQSSSVFITPVSTSVAPSHTFSQPMMSPVASSQSSVALLQENGPRSASGSSSGVNSSQLSEKQRLVLTNPAVPEPEYNPYSSGFPGSSDGNPHRDFPPPDYGQVFSTTSS